MRWILMAMLALAGCGPSPQRIAERGAAPPQCCRVSRPSPSVIRGYSPVLT